MSKRGRQGNAGPKPPENNQNKTLESQGLGLPVLKTVAVPPPLLPEPTAMAAVKLLCAPRLEHYMVLGPVLGQPTTTGSGNTGTTFTNTLEVFMDKHAEEINF
ncbi:hypothetical protein J6590_093515 [Homalodisca vitripennis]|nr:hypothetical protein J6590_099704 [Homalodisca vitripennis]KAG8299740.1 hypothetical protein J6590_093515 [Homalodisca vitripennis]